MVDFLPIIVVGFALSVGLTPLTRQLAHRIGMVDHPNARKAHRAPMPLMGGLAIYGAFLLALLLFHIGPQYVFELSAIILAATWLAIIGFLDDRLDLSPRIKFPAQAAAAITVLLAGIRIDLFHTLVLDVPLTILWIVGIVNAINFLDNMDGLAAGVSAIAALFLFILSASQGQNLVAPLSAAIGGAAIGFLIYNFNPATTFMGDMGALVLGFLLAALGIKLNFPHHEPGITWMIPIMVLGLPIFDTSLVVFTRLREGRSPFKGGRDHTSHRLVGLGFSPRAAVLILYTVCVMLGSAAFLISQVSSQETAYLIGGIVAVIGLISFIGLEIVRIQQQRSKVQ